MQLAVIITTGGLLSTLIYAIVIALVLWGAWALIGLIPNARAQQVCRIIWYVVAGLVALNFLLGLIGHQFWHW